MNKFILESIARVTGLRLSEFDFNNPKFIYFVCFHIWLSVPITEVLR